MKIKLSYISILLGILTMDPNNQQLITSQLPNQSLLHLADIIQEFMIFQFQEGILPQETAITLTQVIKSLKEFKQK